MTLDLPIDKLAEAINHLTDDERESLALLLSKEAPELIRRRDDMTRGAVTGLSENDVFGDRATACL
jgi:hypothetical protein